MPVSHAVLRHVAPLAPSIRIEIFLSVAFFSTHTWTHLLLRRHRYDYSGEWAFAIGLPAKSGVGGCVFVVIPNFGGVAIWSPRLDEMGNSVRGVRFATELVKRFAFHHYDNLNGATQKIDPRRPHGASVQEVRGHVTWLPAVYSTLKG